MKFQRLFKTTSVTLVKRESTIRDAGGAVIRTAQVEVPDFWPQLSVDILADKYLRRAGVPSKTRQIPEEVVPNWLWRSVPEEGCALGGETSAVQVFRRIAGCWTYWGWKAGYFTEARDAGNFFDDIVHLLMHQMAAPNSPQWFNTGLHWAYGICGNVPGQWAIGTDGQAFECDSYERPQAHACYIQSVGDHLLGPGGIMDLWNREARVFKYGGGTGSCFGAIRATGEPLSGGGSSSGLLPWLKIGDSAAGAIKSGGTTRRAAKMVIVPVDHPDIEAFVDWKAGEEDKVAALLTGSRLLRRHGKAIAKAYLDKGEGEAVKRAIRAGVPKAIAEGFVKRFAEAGLDEFPVYDSGFEGQAYQTVSGQNANNSVSVGADFMQAVVDDQEWTLKSRTGNGKNKVIRAKSLWEKIAKAAWRCADPGVFYHGTVNEWNPCRSDGEIKASNPCGEYLFLDDTGCNLASLNLCKFDFQTEAGVREFFGACRLLMVALDITVGMASYPSKIIAERSRDYRTTGLGYANLGTLLMRSGVPYDSDRGRHVAASVTAYMHAAALMASAEMAEALGTFPRYAHCQVDCHRVIENHLAAAGDGKFVGLSVKPSNPSVDRMALKGMLAARDAVWSHGLRNAQVTLLAPTGTIGLLMACDTTGVEPDFSLVKWKKLAGGGYVKIVNESVSQAMERLGYSEQQRADIVRWVSGAGRLTERSKSLLERYGVRQASIASLTEKKLTGLMDVRAGLPDEDANKLPDAAVREINADLLGHLTVEGAPHLRAEHLPVFDCAMPCGPESKRCLSVDAHLNMMAAVQPFLSGGISKTVNLPSSATVDDVAEVYLKAWRLGLKDVALYRDGCKLSQPLSSSAGEGEGDLYDLHSVTVIAEKVIYRAAASREALPSRRNGYTQKVKINGQSLFIRTGEYADGRLGEIFIDLHRQGATLRSMVNCFAIAVSLGLQYGVPLDEFVNAFIFTKFEPSGPVIGHDRLKMATSIIDLIFRELAISYLGRDDLAHVAHQHVQDVPGMAEAIYGGSEARQNQKPASEAYNATEVAVKMAEAKMKGYEGDPCGTCNAFTLVRSGACLRCDTCGSSSGCV